MSKSLLISKLNQVQMRSHSMPFVIDVMMHLHGWQKPSLPPASI